MRCHKLLPIGLTVLGLAACNSLSGNWGKSDAKSAAGQQAVGNAPEAVLYARDGSIVTPEGAAATAALPRREVQNQEGSRKTMLELYEAVVEERDQLRLLVSARDNELAQVRQQLEQESLRANGLETRALAAEQSGAELANQNLELAARLTVAQIKRLEAEKSWLELSIALPTKTVAAGDATNASAPLSAVKPAAAPGEAASEHH